MDGEQLDQEKKPVINTKSLKEATGAIDDGAIGLYRNDAPTEESVYHIFYTEDALTKFEKLLDERSGKNLIEKERIQDEMSRMTGFRQWGLPEEIVALFKRGKWIIDLDKLAEDRESSDYFVNYSNRFSIWEWDLN